ncbi:FAD-binding oxidoreductase [Streptomyces canus]|uniref:FAD-binding oxidoreductase n=1 Tax=Streptomyces TaxID=1883 RepID=UPI0008521610|nr:FAD-binding oxidoreductase [Streptomyces sp. LUP47B]
MLDIIRPDDRRYPGVRHVYTATGSPAAVIRPRSADEVAEALLWAREAGGPLSIRSGGHGLSSVSTNDGGTVIDLGELSSIERIDAGDGLVRIGPGARWGDVARALHPWGLAISSGDSGDVGVGGLATTAGVGLMGRAHGLTIDHIVAARIVTADGSIRTLDAEEEPDLFWAVRGAGANMGIVTSMDFRAAPVPMVAHATFHYGVPRLAPFLRSWGETVEAAPREIGAFLYMGGGEVVMASVVFAGEDTVAAEQAFAPFLKIGRVLGRRAVLTPYASVVTRTGAPHYGQQGAYLHNGFAVHLDGPLSKRLETLLGSQYGTMVQIRSVGGAVNDVPTEATAFAHRHQNFSVTAVAPGPSASFDAAWEFVRPSLDGLYLSFETAFSPQRLTDAFPPPTLQRLREIKRKVDPENVFNQNFPVA